MRTRRLWLIPLLLILVPPIALVAGLLVLCLTADLLQPEIAEAELPKYTLNREDSLRQFGPHTLSLSPHGLWELHIQGSPVERGYAAGQLMPDLLRYQEEAFVKQIRRIIPSDFYLRLMHLATIAFNRRMAQYVPLEYREEIYALSLSCSHEFDDFGTPYQRQLSYHAAHDVGHAMQEYKLVGCSALAVWGSHTNDSSLYVARNFDFYVGDEFAQNKLVLFNSPDSGYRYVSIAWPAMMGVVSGMNQHGLTVTINALRHAPPLQGRMPISLLVRHILQYAKNIDEAYTIARQHRTFVAESILLGSLQDGHAAVIEKTPDTTVLYVPSAEHLACTNQYLSSEPAFADENAAIIASSDSPYRLARLEQLVDSLTPFNTSSLAHVLRDYNGLDGKAIGLGNECAINQFLGHHSVIFHPASSRMWVSTKPWQVGTYAAYDLSEFFHGDSTAPASWRRPALDISPMPLLNDTTLAAMIEARSIASRVRAAMLRGDTVPAEQLARWVTLNPDLYAHWNLLGDYYASHHCTKLALDAWRRALQCQFPNPALRADVEAKVKRNHHD